MFNTFVQSNKCMVYQHCVEHCTLTLHIETLLVQFSNYMALYKIIMFQLYAMNTTLLQVFPQ
jgi:hypothetical protein